MKRVLLAIALVALMFSCKDEKKAAENTVKEIEQKVEDKTTIKLPDNIVQLNEEDFVGNGITLTKVQVQDSKDDNFIFKIFFKTENIEEYKSGDYSIFAQNFLYENDILTDDNGTKGKGVTSYWVNLKNAKPYRDGYVVFKSFKSNIYTFRKTVVGAMNLKTKIDVFRVQYDDSVITN